MAARIDLSSSYGIQMPANDTRPMEREEYLQHVRNLYYTKAYLAPGYTQPDPSFDIALYVDVSQRNANNELVPTDFDWWKAGTKIGLIKKDQVSITGGGEKVNYRLSGGHTTQSGLIINDLFKRSSVRSNIEMQPINGVTIGLQAFGAFVNNDGAEPTLSDLLQQAPLNSPYNADGSLKPLTFNTTGNNPFLSYDVDDLERHNYLFANAYAKVNIPWVKGLSYRLNTGFNNRTDRRANASRYAAGLTGSAYKNVEQYTDRTIDHILTLDRSIGQGHIDLTALYGSVERRDDYTQALANGFTRLNLSYNDLNSGAFQFATSSAWREALNYQMLRLNYAYRQRYLATATTRRDGYSGFAANNKYAVLPSISLGWIISDERFAKASWLDHAKLRIGWGVSGNLTSRYSSLDQVAILPAYVFSDGGTQQAGQYIATLPNPDLKWERTRELDIGTDITVLNGRFSATIDYYRRRTKDLLFTVQIPTANGYQSINTNVGEIGNKGIELTLISKNIKAQHVEWGTTFVFSRNVNKVISLLGTGDLVSSNLFIGQPINTIYGYRLNGIYQVGEVPPAGFFTGNLKVLDINGDNRINTDDRTVLGSADAAYRFSILNRVRHKGLSLSVFVNSVQGGSNGYLGNNSPVQRLDDNAVRYNYISGINFWNPRNPDGRYPLYLTTPVITPNQYFSRSFIRLQDVTLNYKVDNSFMKRLGFKSINVFVSGKNIKTWTRWEGWDPELPNGGLTVTGRPLLSAYMLGLDLTY
jgi:TonB-dependent starch-binding outer membrane protein SusC